MITLQKTIKGISAVALLIGCISTVQAERAITDQLGRSVTIPDEVNRAVVLQHQTLNLLVQLDAKQNVVGILSSWKNSLALTTSGWHLNLKHCRCPET